MSNEKDASFPSAPGKKGLPGDYAHTLESLKERIRNERLRVTLSANAAMVLLYWDIGRHILERQEREGWGAKVIDRLAHDLSAAFPDMTGLSSRNFKFMRAFADAFPDVEIVKQLVSQIPWGHIIRLMQKVKDPGERLWYVRKTLENGWSRDVLVTQIESGLHRRVGGTVNNFALTLPPEDSDLAEQVFKDPYLFDFLGTDAPRREREVEQALMEHLKDFLLELGAGFAFVGLQKRLEVEGEEYRIDLLFYHLRLRCYVVVELKAVPFDPAFVGQLNLYLSAVDDLLRHPDDKPSIGLLLCKSRKKLVVEYALRGLDTPMGVAEWTTRLTEELPEELKDSLPSIEAIEAEFSGDATNE